jgi:hypothetical protein
MFANSTNPAPNVENDIMGTNADRLLQSIEGRCPTRQQLCLFRRSGNA